MKRVVFPGFPGDPSVEPLFRSSGYDVAFCLSEAERAMGYFAPDRADARRRAIADALRETLPHAAALSAMAVGEPLRITADMIAQAPELEVIFFAGSGTDSIDVAAATARGIPVLNAPTEVADMVAEHTIALILALTRRIASADRRAHGQRSAVARAVVQNSRPPLASLRDKTLGLVGYGHIGRAVARIARHGFGMKVVAFAPRGNAGRAVQDAVALMDLPALLAAADVVSIHVPLTAQTHRLLGAPEIAMMKPSALLINAARGATVNTDALVAALQRGDIAGAGLDVTDPEPLPDGHPLFDMDNVVLTPHMAGTAPDVSAQTARSIAARAIQALRGTRPDHIVNPEAWDRYRQTHHAL